MPLVRQERQPARTIALTASWAQSRQRSWFQLLELGQGFRIVWDEATLDKWITNPGAVIPDNNMAALFGGIDDASVRAKIIAFLKQDTQMTTSAKK